MTEAGLLFSYYALQLRINAYSPDSFKPAHTLNLNRIDTDSIEKSDRMYPVSFHFINRNRYLLGFSPFINTNPSEPDYNLNDRFEYFYLINDKGDIISDQIFR